jgi:hypothetical protein
MQALSVTNWSRDSDCPGAPKLILQDGSIKRSIRQRQFWQLPSLLFLQGLSGWLVQPESLSHRKDLLVRKGLAKDHHAGETYLDLGAPGPSNGDRVEFADRLFDTRGNEVGRNVADCVHVIVGPPPASATELGSCQITLLLKEGKVVLAGAYGSDEMPAGALSFAVVGGTGRYRGAKGEAVSQFLHNHSAWITVRFE